MLNSGVIDPGGLGENDLPAYGCMQMNSLTANTDGVIAFWLPDRLTENTACITQDKLVVTESDVTLNSPTLILAIPSGGANFFLTEPAVLIDKQSPGAISGSFNGIPQGFTVGTLQIRYDGGDGNDMVLATPAGVPSAPSISAVDAYQDGLQILITAGASQGATQFVAYRLTCMDAHGAVVYDEHQTEALFEVTGLEMAEQYICAATAANQTGYSYASITQTFETTTATGLPVWLLYEASQSP